MSKRGSPQRTSVPEQDPRRIASPQVTLEIGAGWYGGWAWMVGLGGKGPVKGLAHGWNADRGVAVAEALDVLKQAAARWEPL